MLKVSCLIVVTVVLIDQLSKWLVINLSQKYICNQGLVFGIKVPNILILAVVGILLVMLLWKRKSIKILFKNNQLDYKIGWLVFGAALSNLIDRLWHGCVIDFIDIKIFNYPWFNLADSLIVLGGFYLIWHLLKYKKN